MAVFFGFNNTLLYAQSPPPEVFTSIFGGNQDEIFTSWAQTPGAGGYLIGGTSSSGISSPTKTTAGFGGKDFYIVKVGNSGLQAWEKTFGGSGDDELKSIVAIPSGGYYLAGTSTSGINGSKSENSRGGKDYWVIRIDANGNKLWDKRFGGSQNDELTCATVDYQENCLLGGYSTSGSGASSDKTSNPITSGQPDYWVVKVLISGGSKAWDVTVGGSGNVSNGTGIDMMTSIQQVVGGFVLGGYSNSGTNTWKTAAAFDDGNDPNTTNFDFWLVKITHSGTYYWDKTLGGTEEDKLYDMAQTDEANHLIIAGASRSKSNGNKTSSPTINSNVTEHIWAMKIDAGNTGQGTVEWQRNYQAVAGQRSFYNNISVAGSAQGYYIALSSKELNGFTKRVDKFNWAGTQQWSKNISSNIHHQPSRLPFQIPANYNFSTDVLPYQAKRLYQGFLNAWNNVSTTPTYLYPDFITGIFARYFPSGETNVDIYSMRGAKNYQNHIKSFIDEGIYDVNMLHMIQDILEPIYTNFRTSNLRFPAGRAVPGSAWRINGTGPIIVMDPDADDFGQTFDWTKTGQKTCAMRRKGWLTNLNKDADLPSNLRGEWGQANPTLSQRESWKYKQEALVTNTRKRLLYLNERGQMGNVRAYGTADIPLEFQLSSEFLLWGGYLMDLNRDLDPSFASAADILWTYLQNDWYPEATRIMGARDATTKIHGNPSNLYHATAAHASIYLGLKLWGELPNRTDPQYSNNVTAFKYQFKKVLDNIRIENVPSNAPEYNKYIGKKFALWSHNVLDTSTADITYMEEYLGMVKAFYSLGVTDINGNKLTDEMMEAMSNTHAFTVERFDIGDTPSIWHISTNLGYGSGSGDKLFLNNGITLTGILGGRNTILNPANIDSGDLLDTERPVGGSLLPWDKTGRQYRMYNYRGKTQTVKSQNQFDPAVVIANPSSSMNKYWGWLCTDLLLALRNPEKDVANPTNIVKFDMKDEKLNLYTALSTNEQIMILNSKDDSGSGQGYNFAFKKLGQISPVLQFASLEETLEADDVSGNGSLSMVPYPNPSSVDVTLLVKNAASGKAEFRIYSVNGSLVKIFNHTISSATTQIPVNVSHLATGVYTVNMEQSGNTVSAKMVIQ